MKSFLKYQIISTVNLIGRRRLAQQIVTNYKSRIFLRSLYKRVTIG